MWLELQPTLAQLGTTLTKDLLPALQKIWQAIAPVLIPVMKVWIGLIANNLKTSFQVIAGAISFVAALLTGDFAGAWQAAQKVAQAVMNGIIGVYNNTIGRLPGVSKIDMQTFADNVDTSATKAAESISTSMADSVISVKDAGTKIIQSEKATSKELAKEQEKRLEATETFWADMAQSSADYRKDELAANLTLYDATNTEYKLALASLSTMSADHLAALQAGNDDASDHELAMQIIANRDYAEAQKTADDAAVLVAKTIADDALAAEVLHRADLLTALDSHIGLVAEAIKTADGNEKTALETQLSDLKKKRDAAYTASQTDRLTAAQAEIDAVAEKIQTAQGAELAALQAHQALLIAQYGTLVAGINAEIAKVAKVPAAAAGDLAPGEGRDLNNPGGSRKGGLDDAEIEAARAAGRTHIVDPYNGKVYAFNYGGAQTNVLEPGVQDAAIAALVGGQAPGAQRGSLIRGVRSPLGRMIRVGENGTDEGIFPLPPGLLDALRNGSGGGAGGGRQQPLVIPVSLGGETLATIYVEGKRVAVRESRD